MLRPLMAHLMDTARMCKRAHRKNQRVLEFPLVSHRPGMADAHNESLKVRVEVKVESEMEEKAEVKEEEERADLEREELEERAGLALGWAHAASRKLRGTHNRIHPRKT